MQTEQTEQKIKRNLTIGDVVSKYPSCVEVLLSHGVHCVGCQVAFMETLEDGFRSHGMSEEKIDQIIKELNEAIPDEPKQSGELIITKKAVEKLRVILKEQKKEGYGLRIQVIPGGCSGYSYGMDFEEKPTADDTVIEKEGMKFIVDTESLNMLKGATVDYVDSLQGAGFRISNPNATSTCGCGQSFS